MKRISDYLFITWIIFHRLFIELPWKGIVWLWKHKSIRIFVFCMFLFLGSVEFVTLDLQNVLYWEKDDKIGFISMVIIIILGSVFGPKMD